MPRSPSAASSHPAKPSMAHVPAQWRVACLPRHSPRLTASLRGVARHQIHEPLEPTPPLMPFHGLEALVHSLERLQHAEERGLLGVRRSSRCHTTPTASSLDARRESLRRCCDLRCPLRSLGGVFEVLSQSAVTRTGAPLYD
mmetsp:Transcript_26421/g.67046  ORF Transcript_26421/g.67046 Transcript_26421/m.67046 type:complete len:142 (-) Transcript_26421:644-1069(-)